MQREISRRVKNSAELAAFRASAHSLETADSIQKAFRAPLSPVPKSRFLETETACVENGSIELLLCG
jgi:hypothetical protein